MKKKHLLLIIVACIVYNVSGKPLKKTTDGYPLANFSITASSSADGSFFDEILVNPGKLGEWLESIGRIKFTVEKSGKILPFSAFSKKNVTRQFPFVRNSYQQQDFINAKIETEAFCPIGVNDLKTSSLPAILIDFQFSTDKAEKFNIVLNADSVDGFKFSSITTTNNVYSVDIGNCRLTSSHKIVWNKTSKNIYFPIDIQSGKTENLRIILTFWDSAQVYTQWFQNSKEVGEYVEVHWNELKEKTLSFNNSIPATGDKELDNFLRWYMVPGISLTKCTNKNEVLTMGYRELNQRDSYWTTWLHLVLYKDLERKMILESIEYQQQTGKIPTTILPLIERNDDIDINAFFILRDARYYRYYHDKEALSADWAALIKAMDWLISRDLSGNGIPEQVSFWGDWKDVGGVKDRKYSPFSGLIYLAALKEMIYLSKELADNESVIRYSEAYDKGYLFINKTVEEGGLWNGNYYCQRWKDGTVNTHLLQDQTIGILFGTVPVEKGEKIIESLNKQSLTEFGIAETTPYYPESFGYKPATYHNGAVWPWLSFMDCWARVAAGRKDEAIDLVKRVANADLVASGDWSPNEHINSLTGENLGFRLQGWNAGLFGLVYFGLINNDIEIIPYKALTVSTLKEKFILNKSISNISSLESNFSEKYSFFISQPLDHKHPEKGNFRQRVTVCHAGFDRPTVFVTEGYGASYAMFPRYSDELSRLLNTNIIVAEHRYFLQSTPENAEWEFLTAENSACDLHNIKLIFEDIYRNKWISTGISKGGQTTMIYRAFFPDDVDISVPYVAPLCKGVEDGRHEPFLRKVGTKMERKAILDFQIEALKRKPRLLSLLDEFCKEKKYKFRIPIAEVYDYCVLEYSFAFWQWGTQITQIPALTDSDKTIFDHLMQISGADYFAEASPNSSFFVQAARELGYYGYDIKPFRKYLTINSSKGYLQRIMAPSDALPISFDPYLYHKIYDFLKNNDPKMIFIYGEVDPWSSVHAPIFKHKTNEQFYFQPKGSHRTRIGTMPEEMRQTIINQLNDWLK